MAAAIQTIRRPKPDLVPHLVDRLAQEQPDAAYGLWPVASDSYDAGFRTITYSQLANVVNNLAWWITKYIGPPPKSAAEATAANEQYVLAYIGPNEVRLTALIIASLKAGYTLFLTSPRNSLAAHTALFETLQCKTLITADALAGSSMIGPLIEVLQARHLTVPSIDDLVSEPATAFVFGRFLPEGASDPLLVVHTSGSTGLPKPLILRQDYILRHLKGALSPLPHWNDGLTSIDQFIWGKRVLVTVPSFHGAGLMQYLHWAIGLGCVPIAPAAVGIVTAHGLVEALKNTPADVAILVPSVIADLAENSSLLAYCAIQLKLILYIGGDLPQAVGDIVAASIPLRCWWGASEVGIPHQLTPSSLGPADWRYVCFHPSVGATFDRISGDSDLYELVIRQDKSLPQAAFTVKGQEDLVEYRTKDIFQPHPTVADCWRWRSRADDIIVLLNGEKTNPVSMEQHVTAQNREVAGALVVGTRRFQTGLLIEPASLSLAGGRPLNTSEQAALIERIWSSVQEANTVTPAHARIHKSFIAVVDRPMIRAGKGTLQRASNMEQYHDEIERLYANADVTVDSENAPGEDSGDAYLDSSDDYVDPSDAQSVGRFIRDSVRSVLDGTGTGLDGATITGNFFEHGIDSLMALQLIRRLRRGLHRPDLGLSTVYANPTVAQLTAAITAKQAQQEPAVELLAFPRLVLQDVLSLFEASRAGIDSIEEQQATAKLVQDFLHRHAASLDKTLDAMTETQAAELYERQVYLQRREPLQEYSTFSLVHPVTSPLQDEDSQVVRATLLTQATILYIRQLEAGKLAPDELHGSPLDSEYRKWLFHAVRRPGTAIDTMKRFSPNRNIIVLRRGHIFQLTFPEAHEPIQTSAIYQTFTNIINASQEPLPAVSAFTAADRQSWAEGHAELAQYPTNSETLAALECCAFVVCLDTESPATAGERHMQFLLNGTDANLSNRWLDKPFQLAVTANGASAGVFEHSKLDGMDVRALHHDLSKAVSAEATEKLVRELPSYSAVQATYPLRELRWELNSEIVQRIAQIQERTTSLYGPVDQVKVAIEGLGFQQLQGHSVLPNATANLIVLLAVYMVDKEVRPAWEVVSLARLRHGRIDWVQTVTLEVRTFLEAAVASPADRQKLRELFKNAASTHARLVMNAAHGRGYVKHMYTLSEAVAQSSSDGAENGGLFDGHAWNATRRGGQRQDLKIGFMSTEEEGSAEWDEGGFLIEGDRGVYVHCNVEKQRIKFVVSARPQYAAALRGALQVAADRISLILGGNIS